MDIIKKAIRVGNSAGVLLPKKLLGADIKITVVDRPFSIKKEALNILNPYFENLLGIFILNKKPAEVLAVSSNLTELIESDKIKASIVPLSLVKKDIKTKPILRQKLMNAETILNSALLSDLQKIIKENYKIKKEKD